MVRQPRGILTGKIVKHFTSVFFVYANDGFLHRACALRLPLWNPSGLADYQAWRFAHGLGNLDGQFFVLLGQFTAFQPWNYPYVHKHLLILTERRKSAVLAASTA